jgi:hypothetical protein
MRPHLARCDPVYRFFCEFDDPTFACTKWRLLDAHG